MRIAICNWTRRRVGGVETYLSLLIPALLRRGHEVAFWHETEAPHDRPEIIAAGTVPIWCAERLGAEASLRALANWTPDITSSHVIDDPDWIPLIQKIGPAVFFAHNYYGTCIAGTKAHQFPTARPCTRHFGPACLLLYYPRRCGGLNPMTMWRLYRNHAKRLRYLPGYRAVITHSEHMRAEYVKHGVPEDKAFFVNYCVAGADGEAASVESPPLGAGAEVNLLFAGRMDYLKGGRVMLQALPAVQEQLGRPVRAIFAGDGPERPQLERLARRVARRNARIIPEFTGWIGRDQFQQAYSKTHLLVVPSVWPEPFGLVGPEAGLRGIPAAAFRVGGISTWLIDGVNGHLAPGDPPRPGGLADAICRCLSDEAHYRDLRQGAIAVARRFHTKAHVSALERVFASVIGVPPLALAESEV